MADFNNTRPETCYGTLNTTGELIIIKNGVKGYYPTNGYALAGEIDTYDKLADLLNEKRGVTREQRLAMQAGSIFGFDVPLAEPANHRVDVLIEKLDAIDTRIGDQARIMRREARSYDEMEAAFKRAIEVRRQDELAETALANIPADPVPEGNARIRRWLEQVRALRAEFEAAGHGLAAEKIGDVEQELCDSLDGDEDEDEDDMLEGEVQ